MTLLSQLENYILQLEIKVQQLDQINKSQTDHIKKVQVQLDEMIKKVDLSQA